MLLDEAEALVPGILRVFRGTAVNHDRQLGSACQLHLADKNLALHLTRRMVVKVVESDLSPGQHLGMLSQLREFFEVLFACQLRFMGMDADGRINPVVPIGELYCAVKGTGAGSTAYGEDIVDPSGPGALEHLCAISIKLLHLKMCV